MTFSVRKDQMKEDRTSTAKNRTAARIFFYVAGICILALGLTLSTKTKLGASPIIAVAFCISELSGIELGDATFFLYSFFILVQIALHLLPGKRTPSDKKKAVVMDILQLPFSIFFTRLLNLYAAVIPAPQTLAARILVLVLGLTKNIVDVCCVLATCALSLAFTRHIIGIGIGTLAGMLGTGRVIALFNRQFGSYLIPLGKPSSNHP